MKSHFKFTKRERSGIFFLLLAIVLLQVASLLFSRYPKNRNLNGVVVDTLLQSRIDSLKQVKLQKTGVKIFPFNPNYISNHKGYMLGMSPIEIDRLRAFRAKNNFVNSKEEFQAVTQVSDSLLDAISPYFKFPEWAKKNKGRTASKNPDIGPAPDRSALLSGEDKPTVRDLNTASANELRTINGVGEVLSKRIVKFRRALGGFLVDAQLYDVYGLDSIVVERVLQRFQVRQPPTIEPINVNAASVWELSKLPYLQKEVAQDIVDHRNANGLFKSFDELQNIEGFPSNKIDRIQLYLQL